VRGRKSCQPCLAERRSISGQQDQREYATDVYAATMQLRYETGVAAGVQSVVSVVTAVSEREAVARRDVAAATAALAAARAEITDLRRRLATARASWRTDTPPAQTRLLCVVGGRIAICTYRQRANGEGQWFDDRGQAVRVERWTEVQL
jgi:hypothetical protein